MREHLDDQQEQQPGPPAAEPEPRERVCRAVAIASEMTVALPAMRIELKNQCAKSVFENRF